MSRYVETFGHGGGGVASRRPSPSEVTDANGNITTTQTDILGRTLSVTPPTGPSVAYGYDELGNLTSATRGGAVVSMTYDNAGRKEAMDDPDMGVWSYDYDALGNLTGQTDARGCTTNLTYDLLNRLKQKTYSNCPATSGVTYYYDGQTFSFNGNTYGSSPYAIGRRTGAVVSATDAAAWTYDERGRVASEKRIFLNSIIFTTGWTYNDADLPKTMTYPDNEVVTYNYNDQMQPISATGYANYVTSMIYDSAGRVTSRALGNGLTQAFGYYAWNEQVNGSGQGGRLESLVTGTLQNLNYVYDKVGNIAQITNSLASETSVYGYDSLDRLTSWTLNGTTETYTYYEDSGNLKYKNGLLLDYPDANGSNPTHPHAVTSAGTNTYTYDQNGNQATRTIGGQTVTLDYDAENRLITVSGTGLSASFKYDNEGQRVKSVINGEVVYFVGGYYEFNDTTDEITKYYMAGGARVAVRKYIIPETTTLNYILGDHLGSTSVVTDASGVLVVETRYKPWGEVRFTTAGMTLPTRFTFTGQYSYVSDDATDLGNAGFGLIYFNARWMDPLLGRFAQADSIVPTQTQGTQAWDRYAFVNNNPVRYNDPTGHEIGWGQIFTGIALALDVTGVILSGIEAVVVDMFAGGLIAAGCATGGGCGPAIGAAIGADIVISEISPIGIAENLVGAGALLFTAAADFTTGASYIELNESGGIAIGIGQNTMVSALTMDLGFLPEANVDFAVSAAQLTYDLYVGLSNTTTQLEINLDPPQDLWGDPDDPYHNPSTEYCE